MEKKYKIAVAGTGYVGLSIATLLSQHHNVVAVDVIKEKVDCSENGCKLSYLFHFLIQVARSF